MRIRVFLAVLFAFVAPLVPGAVPSSRADEGCTPTVAGAPTTPVGRTTCTDVRPGTFVETGLGGCTLNFLFVDDSGRRYMGTAGHCAFESYGDQTWAAGKGPVVEAYSQPIGRFAYGVHDYERDFALIRLDDGVAASPEMAHFGGPTGLYTEHSITPVRLHHYGNGIVAGNLFNKRNFGVGDSDIATVPARSGVAPNTLSTTQVVSYSAATFGDSGSGVIDSAGRAVGVMVTLGGIDFALPVPSVGTNGITRLDYELARAETELKTTLTLQTAPLRATS